MFEYMKIKTNYFIRCLQCQYIDKVEHAINVESPWTCDRCGHVGNLHEVKAVKET